MRFRRRSIRRRAEQGRRAAGILPAGTLGGLEPLELLPRLHTAELFFCYRHVLRNRAREYPAPQSVVTSGTGALGAVVPESPFNSAPPRSPSEAGPFSLRRNSVRLRSLSLR